jgi:pre-mRNA-splicing factor SPF27
MTLCLVSIIPCSLYLQLISNLVDSKDIDPAPTPQQRAAIASLITASLAPEHLTTPHSLLPEFPPSVLSPLLEEEIARHASNKPHTGGIDTSRYEALDAPTSANPADHHTVLQKAYTSSIHLRTRNQNLALLEQFGKNAWLVGNAQLEDILRDVEREVVDVKQQTEEVNKIRKAGQEGVRGEMEGLESAWKEGVRGVVEAEIAAEGLRSEILRQRREGAER